MRAGTSKKGKSKESRREPRTDPFMRDGVGVGVRVGRGSHGGPTELANFRALANSPRIVRPFWNSSREEQRQGGRGGEGRRRVGRGRRGGGHVERGKGHR